MSTVTTEQNYSYATIEHLKFARNGGAIRARFRNGVTGPWTTGYLVGWIQCDRPWVCGRFEDTDHLVEECDFFQYCEVLT